MSLLFDDFTTGSDGFSVPPVTVETHYQQGSTLGGVRSTTVNNSASPKGTPARLDIGGAGRLRLTLDAEQYARLEVTYGIRPDGTVADLGLNLREAGADRFRTTISRLDDGAVNFNMSIGTPTGYSSAGKNACVGQTDFLFSEFAGPAGQDFTHVSYIVFVFTVRGSMTLDSVETLSMALSTEIAWPNKVVDVSGIFDETAVNVLGEPDGAVFVVGPGRTATFADFRGQGYPSIVQLLARHHVIFGDSVTGNDCGNAADPVALADFIAFERNGSAPAPGGGWERCDFTFSDVAERVSVSWAEGEGVPRDPHILANGSIRGADYKRFFEVGGDGSSITDSEVISYLLITLPEVDTGNPGFTVTVTGRPPGETASFSPDVDAIGVLRRGT
ncbi:hypothetical protein ABT010_24680 [Streptomyces sp. NPDC002668]|uniref:hypothetical protein n=1 Tax=Streptomyces sp. NPDC002668 TaxID=3154422 RepID=UPI00331F8A0D